MPKQELTQQLVDIIENKLTKQELPKDKGSLIPPPEGWITRKTLSTQLGVDFYTVEKCVSLLRDTNAEWFQLFKPLRRSASEYLSPEVIPQVINSLGKKAPEGWETRAGLSRQVGVDWNTGRSFAERYRKDHPEWFGSGYF